MKIIALICAKNEEKTIKEVIVNVKKHVNNIIVVDDGSDDKTPFILSHLKNGIDIISYPINMGKGYALRQGFKRFLESDGDILVTIDADGQHDPKQIKDLTLLVEKGTADIMIGTRYHKIKGYPKFKILLNVLTNFGLMLASGAFFSDSASGFRAYSRRAIETIYPNLTLDGFGIELEILKFAAENELKIGFVPVTCSYKKGKKNNILKLAKGHLTFMWRYKGDMIHKIFG